MPPAKPAHDPSGIVKVKGPPNRWPIIICDPGGITGVILLAGQANAATYAIDTGVQSGITDLLTSFVTGAFAIIVVAVGIVGGYYVTVRLVHVLLRWFHKFA